MSKEAHFPAVVAAANLDTGRVDPRWLPLVEDYATARVGRARARLPADLRAARRGHRAGGAQQGSGRRSARGARTTRPPRVGRVAARAAIDAVRRARARRKERLPAQAADATPFDPQTRRAAAVLEDIHRVLATLSARGRLALALDLQGFTPAEIARARWASPRPRARRLVEQGRGAHPGRRSTRAPGAPSGTRTRSAGLPLGHGERRGLPARGDAGPRDGRRPRRRARGGRRRPPGGLRRVLPGRAGRAAAAAPGSSGRPPSPAPRRDRRLRRSASGCAGSRSGRGGRPQAER